MLYLLQGGVIMNENNSVCSICGKAYYLCMSCKETIKLNPWKIHTDTPEHYKIFQIIRGYNTGIYDKNAAREKLLKLDLKDVETFRENIKSIINEILKVENIEKKYSKQIKSKKSSVKELNVETFDENLEDKCE